VCTRFRRCCCMGCISEVKRFWFVIAFFLGLAPYCGPSAQTTESRGQVVAALRLVVDESVDLETRLKAADLALSLLDQRDRTQSEVWAAVQGTKAGLLLDRSKGARAENVEQAIQAFQHALEILTREVHPKEWADLERGIGRAFLERVEGGAF